MEHVFDTRSDASQVTVPQPSTTLLGEVLARWPTAPVGAVGETGRWLTFERANGPAVYLQRYAWDDRTVPCYLVVIPTSADRTEQHRCSTLDEAVATVKRVLASRPAPCTTGLLDGLAELCGGGQPVAA